MLICLSLSFTVSPNTPLNLLRSVADLDLRHRVVNLDQIPRFQTRLSVQTGGPLV